MQEGRHHSILFLCGLLWILKNDGTDQSELLLQMSLNFSERMWLVVDIVC